MTLRDVVVGYLSVVFLPITLPGPQGLRFNSGYLHSSRIFAKLAT